ncbi:hypothetical protein [Streptomyces microflavus]|uniref:hypothetical protein n=1 Tax=Streptomyces microflavus TaxID=1919 RepID=UPI0032527D45
MNHGAYRSVLIGIEAASDSDLEELEALTLQLRERLLELDVESVNLAREDAAPAGTKVGESIALGALVVSVAWPVLRQVVDLLKTWIENRPVRTISVTVGENTLEVQAVPKADQQRIISAFIDAHQPAPDQFPPLSGGHSAGTNELP